MRTDRRSATYINEDYKLNQTCSYQTGHGGICLWAGSNSQQCRLSPWVKFDSVKYKHFIFFIFIESRLGVGYILSLSCRVWSKDWWVQPWHRPAHCQPSGCILLTHDSFLTVTNIASNLQISCLCDSLGVGNSRYDTVTIFGPWSW